jgi:predicted RNA-binding Zn ribbon-like protein
VTGENYRQAPQPGGREPAPGELALVQAFVNTHWDLAAGGGEVLTGPGALRGWLHEHGLGDARVTAGDLDRALAVREGLRALAFANNEQALDAAAVERLRAASEGAQVGVSVSADGAAFVAPRRAAVDGALGLLLAAVARSMIDGSWPRFKACPGRHCGWAFFDHSRNQSARWCSMKVCGDREKARAYYQRRR